MAEARSAAERGRMERERQKEQEDRRRREEQERTDAERRRLLRAAEPTMPLPTREERVADAKARYEHTLGLLDKAGLAGIELKAAQDKAKQDYLRGLDGLL